MGNEIVVEYAANKSGGSWWLTDKDWLALQKKGWRIAQGSEFVWAGGKHRRDADGLPVVNRVEGRRELGAIATYAFKKFNSIKDAIEEFEKITGANVMDEGCNCCGPPHAFSWDGGYCSGEDCGEYLYGENAKLTKRELLEK